MDIDFSQLGEGTTALGHGVAYAITAAMIAYLGTRSTNMMRIPRLTATGIALFFALDRLRLAMFWIAQSVGFDISPFTSSTEVIWITNLGLVIFLVFAWHEREKAGNK